MNLKYTQFDLNDKIGIVTLNNPQKRNALSLDFLNELNVLFNEIKDNHEISVVIIKSEGPAFSSGHDVREILGNDADYCGRIFAQCGEFMYRLQNMPQVIISQVQGIATAAGCQLVAASDLAVAEEGARFGTPGVSIGLFCTTPAIPLVRAIGRKKALEMLLTGRLISAHEALEYGLVNSVVKAPELNAATFDLAGRVAKASPLVLSIGKKAFYSQINMYDAAAYSYGTEVMLNNLNTEDAREGLTAFIEKREPAWKAR